MRNSTLIKLATGIFVLSFPANAVAQIDIPQFLDSRYSETEGIARTLWEYAEVGYQEEKSSGLLQETLSAEGFEIEAGVAGMPTAFVASYGGGGPVIAILAEYDALPGITQDATSTRRPVENKGASHACGHNLFGAGSVSAAIAVKHWLEETGTPGTIRLYGTPAEEGGSGKVYMVRDGLFDDVDIALHWHASGFNSAAAITSLANRSAKFRFQGLSAHAARAPEKARSALDGVEAFNYMANLMREHVPQQTRIHYVITNGGLAPNVVPDFAEVYYYVRHPEAARGSRFGRGSRNGDAGPVGDHPRHLSATRQRNAGDDDGRETPRSRWYRVYAGGAGIRRGSTRNAGESCVRNWLTRDDTTLRPVSRLRLDGRRRRVHGRTDRWAQSRDLGARHYVTQLAGGCGQRHEHRLQGSK